ncbi:MAG TPA: DEAD/DEAH box helicase, partial [Humisphaera sp.]
MLFADLKLAEPLLRALESEKYETATPIQAQAIPHVIAGKDVLGSAQTGTGKTAAFALPILQRLMNTPAGQQAANRKPRVLVLAPTRELATQIATGFKTYGQNLRWLRYSVVFGGVSQHGQVSSLRSGVDVIIACPGRLLDLMNQGFCDLSGIDTLVLDEADRMLDMGFIHDIRRIVAKVPAKRQTLFFSATMPPEIRKLADTLLHHPVTVAVAPVSQVADRIDERVYFVEKTRKPQLLAHLVKDLPMYRAIVFTRTKHGADKVVRKLDAFGIRSAAIHGNKSQNNRNRALHAFKENKIGVLVATDIAARGIDIDGVTHVVNFDVTHEPETYVHRIGRTARAGASGHAISFCDRDERADLTAIERLTKRKIRVEQTPDADVLPADPTPREDRRDRHPREERDPRAGGGVRRTEMKPDRGEHRTEHRPHAPRQDARPAASHPHAPRHRDGGRPQHP